MEFIAKQKKLKVTVGGQSYEMRCPTIGESEELNHKIKDGKPEEALQTYKSMFSKLGLPETACDEFDTDDFMDFIAFVLSPKKKPQVLNT